MIEVCQDDEDAASIPKMLYHVRHLMFLSVLLLHSISTLIYIYVRELGSMQYLNSPFFGFFLGNPCMFEDMLKWWARARAQFRKISELEQVAPNEMVDVLGVVDRVEGTNTIQRKDGSEARAIGLGPGLGYAQQWPLLVTCAPSPSSARWAARRVSEGANCGGQTTSGCGPCRVHMQGHCAKQRRQRGSCSEGDETVHGRHSGGHVRVERM